MDSTQTKPKEATEVSQTPSEQPHTNAQQAGELDERALDAVSGGTTATSTLSNIANMKHEALKAIAQNLRG